MLGANIEDHECCIGQQRERDLEKDDGDGEWRRL
jgi:hypothetical protein